MVYVLVIVIFGHLPEDVDHNGDQIALEIQIHPYTESIFFK